MIYKVGDCLAIAGLLPRSFWYLDIYENYIYCLERNNKYNYNLNTVWAFKSYKKAFEKSGLPSFFMYEFFPAFDHESYFYPHPDPISIL